MRLESWEGSVLTKEGNDPRPEGRDERRVEGKDWAMAAKPEGDEPEGRPRPEGRPGMRLDSWEGRPGMRLDSWEGSVLTRRVMIQDRKVEMKEG